MQDCIEDMAIFTAQVKMFSMIFLQYKDSWAWQNFYLHTSSLKFNPSYNLVTSYYNLTKRLVQPCYSFKYCLVTALSQGCDNSLRTDSMIMI